MKLNCDGGIFNANKKRSAWGMGIGGALANVAWVRQNVHACLVVSRYLILVFDKLEGSERMPAKTN